jgi:hypothetical protein
LKQDKDPILKKIAINFLTYFKLNAYQLKEESAGTDMGRPERRMAHVASNSPVCALKVSFKNHTESVLKQ